MGDVMFEIQHAVRVKTMEVKTSRGNEQKSKWQLMWALDVVKCFFV